MNTAFEQQRKDRLTDLLSQIDLPAHPYRLTARLADLTGADTVFFSAPGLVGTPSVRRALMNDTSITEVLCASQTLTLALVGIGSLDPSPLLQRSGNAIAETEQAELRKLGAVGDVCLRFFDARGKLVKSTLDQRIVGIAPADEDRGAGWTGGLVPHDRPAE